MPIKDLLIHVDTFPDATPTNEIDDAVAFAHAVGAKLSALALSVTIPLESNRVADYLIGLSKIVSEQETLSEEAGRKAVAHFTKQAGAAGVLGEAILRKTDLYDAPRVVAEAARTRDICLVPLGGRYTGQREVAETVIFQSGRPALIFTGRKKHFAEGVRRVVVAWDGGACAARAIAEAMPLLTAANEVRVVVVLGEKPALKAGQAAGLVKHLAAHGIDAAVDEIDAAGRSIGDALDQYLRKTEPDLLVMGAYGHSRLREFVLGGATEHMLWAGKVPTLFSH